MRMALALLLVPATGLVADITVDKPIIPLAPPGAMVHAAYMTISNTDDVVKQLVGVSAEGYAMAHMHKTEVKGDVATMLAVDVLEIAPGQSVVFESGGLHLMLMHPEAPARVGDTVALTLEFSDGSTDAVSAKVVKMIHGGHGSQGDHGS
ncbi:copper chaperone PCu(A)C [Roseobacter sinensis]|uniref:Copper chaperone PCu(A)C n=1 Tax=Roseobacter sinensis TaxID=2931391 RepID=A0ABT3BI95_9RHOB|nr:copper chaperone PCu(A)C [Roseobacter sp. WL0113]MCV3273296.1 copper chaperone PCu(A)C [Roseobacter sp. WL0113]